jgi:tetratricopeptide (TPR) repeat protein
MRSILALAALLLLPSVASADARKDIVELRHGRTSSHVEFLGWTDDGRAVARRLVCSEGGEVACRASIDALAVGSPEHTTLLWQNSESLYETATADDPKGPISTAEATAFIRAESKALARLATLSPGERATDPVAAFGTIGGEPTAIYVRTASHPDPDEEPALRLHVAVRGPRGVSIDLESLDNMPWRVDAQEVLHASTSPDGSAVWMAIRYEDGVMCWDGEDIELTIADRGQVRAKLANAVGLRADVAGETAEAYARFVEATTEDPTYAWGWWNRGALEGRRGELDAAAQSLGRAIALDASFAERACDDDDYAGLAASDAGATMLACSYAEGC